MKSIAEKARGPKPTVKQAARRTEEIKIK